jgi:SRSO17 transposase
MAARLAPGDYDQMHHFIADGVWDAAPLEAELLVQADRLVGGNDAVLVIDDTSLPKKGDRSVGVAPQYASTLGKTANCQTLVSLTLACGEVPVMVALRLFLPESWTSDPARLKRAGVPIEHGGARSKPEIALAEIDRVIAAGVRFGCVLADAGYGSSAPFRHALSERDLLWAVGLSRHQKVYPSNVTMIFPTEKARKPRKLHIPDMSPVSAETALDVQSRREVDWIVSELTRVDRLAKVVSIEERCEVIVQLLVIFVVMTPNGRLLEEAVHLLDYWSDSDWAWSSDVRCHGFSKRDQRDDHATLQ